MVAGHGLQQTRTPGQPLLVVVSGFVDMLADQKANDASELDASKDGIPMELECRTSSSKGMSFIGEGVDKFPWSWVLFVLLAVHLSFPARAASDIAAAKTIFRKRCTACHTYGKGIKVGPDLKGVTHRRKRDWLLAFVRSSSTVIQSGDPTATKLFQEFRQERMPDWGDLSPEQVGAVLDYFAADGPEQKEPDERQAITATAAEIRMGRDLFYGDVRLTYGGPACATCHSTGSSQRVTGSLGPDLRRSYLKYQDRGLTDYLRQPCFLRDPERSTNQYLSPQESFDLKAYMAQVAGVAIPVPVPTPAKNSTGKNVRSPEARGATQ